MNKSKLRIQIENYRAIKTANIIIDGITVLSGENGSGKSSIGKLTYSTIHTIINFSELLFDSKLRDLKNIEKKTSRILSEIEEKSGVIKFDIGINDLLSKNESNIEVTANSSEKRFKNIVKSISTELSKLKSSIKEHKLSDAKTHRLIEILTNEESIEIENENEEKISILKRKINQFIESFEKETIKTLKEVTDRKLKFLIDQNHFQFSDLEYLKGKINLFEYEFPIIDYEKEKLLEFDSVDKVIFIDSPMSLGVDYSSVHDYWEHLNKYLTTKTSKQLKQNGINFSQIINGEVSVSKYSQLSSKNNFEYEREDEEIFDLLECATGLKSFSILNILFSNGHINNKTLLIIDEPEAHLHPQWVVEYARLIILLNKKYGVRFLIASHHPDMVSAIKYISEKELTDKKLNFYLAEESNNKYMYNYKSLGTEINEIFESFNIALDRLDQYGATE
jgi:predicted ATPase